MKATKAISFFIAGLTLYTPAMAQEYAEPDLYIYEYQEVTDTLKADSIYNAYKATLKEKMKQAWAEPAVKMIAEIDQLMEYETSGGKIATSDPLFSRLLLCARDNKDVTEKELKTVSKGKVPKGFIDKVLKPARAHLQAKIDDYNPPMPSWDNIFKYHIDRYEITYYSNDYQEFDIGNLYGHQTRFVYMESVELPKKRIAIPKPNPDCRDNYFNGNFHSYSDAEHPWKDYESHKWDEAQQSQGWEWATTGDMQGRNAYFPEELSYRFHPAHQEYRFTKTGYYIDRYDAYDEKGVLVRAGNIVGLGQEYEKIYNAVMLSICKRDFLANKYDINKSKPETLLALRITFGMTDAVDARFKRYIKMAQEARDEIVAATTVAQYTAAKKKQTEALNVLLEYYAKEREPKAMNYLAQLKADHSSELSYLYKIERIDNRTFKLYFLNDKKECGCIAFMKWHNKAPYEAEYDIELQPNELIVIRQ